MTQDRSSLPEKGGIHSSQPACSSRCLLYFAPNNLPSSTSSTKEQTHAFLKITAHTPRKNGYILTYSIDIRNIKLITFLMYFQFCVAFLRVQFLGLYSSQCTFILLLMLSMTTNFFYHVYADDTQLYCPSPSDQIDSLLDKISSSTDDTNLWMSANKLKMNTEKIEILLCGTNARLMSVRPNSLKNDENIIGFSPKVKKTLVCA